VSHSSIASRAFRAVFGYHGEFSVVLRPTWGVIREYWYFIFFGLKFVNIEHEIFFALGEETFLVGILCSLWAGFMS